MNLTAIQVAVQDRYATETILIPKLNRLIGAAVRFYSRYNPYLKTTNFDTVYEQQLYDLPADCMQDYIHSVDYWPSGGLSYELSAANEYATLYRRPASYDLISERVIEDIKQEQYIKRVRGQWQIENGQIELWPVPGATATTVYVTYGSVHALNEAGTAYTTIPAEDLEIIRDLTVAEIIEGKRAEFAVEPDYAEGLARHTKHFIPGAVDATVKYLRDKCIQKYGSTAVAV